MSSSVQGNFVDQAWAANLPGYFRDNVKPSVASESFLIPRKNDSVPDIVTRNTVGSVYNRGFIDRPVNRLETTRSFILNPSSYNARLHPHDVTSGTGGIDNLSNLYRFGHPLPFADAEDFADLQFFAKYQKDKGLDPLTEGYAVKAIGEGGSALSSAMAEDRAVLNEKLAMQKKVFDAKKKLGQETEMDRAVLQRAYDEAARAAADEADTATMASAANNPSSAMSMATSIATGIPMSMAESAPSFTRSNEAPVENGEVPAYDIPIPEEAGIFTLGDAIDQGYTVMIAAVPTKRQRTEDGNVEAGAIYGVATRSDSDLVYITVVKHEDVESATDPDQDVREIPRNELTRELPGAQFSSPDAESYSSYLTARGAPTGRYGVESVDSEETKSEFRDVLNSPARAPTAGAASEISAVTNPTFRGTAPSTNSAPSAIASSILGSLARSTGGSYGGSSGGSSGSSSSYVSSLTRTTSSVRSQLAAEAEDAGVSNSSYWDAQMRNTQDVKDLLHLMGARSSNPAAVFSNAYSATPYFVRRTQMGLDGNYSKRQAISMPMRTQSKEPRVEQATSQSGDIFSTAEKASDPRVALLQGRRPGAATYLDPNLAAESGAFKQIEFHAGNNRYDGNIEGPSEQASLSIRNPTYARNMTGGVSRDFVKPTPENRQTSGVLGKNQRTPSANITIANRASTNPVSAFRGGSAPLRR